MTSAAERLDRVASLLGASAEELLDEWEALAPPAGSHHPQSALSEPEARALTRAGVRVAPVPALHDRASASTLEHLIQMRLDGLTTKEAAALLRLTEGRIRQRIAADLLFAVKGPGGEWRLPRWQFHGRHTIPGLSEVLAAVPRGWPPVAIERFLTEPTDELAMAGAPTSPLAWLSEGRDAGPVATLASQLDIGL